MKSTELIEMALKKNLTQERVVGNIYLVGMMGAGKTTIGKLLAECLDKKFIDSDREIQKSTGVTIPVIFEIEGEAGFRKRETEILRELVKIKKNCTGDRWWCSTQPRKLRTLKTLRYCYLSKNKRPRLMATHPIRQEQASTSN